MKDIVKVINKLKYFKYPQARQLKSINRNLEEKNKALTSKWTHTCTSQKMYILK